MSTESPGPGPPPSPGRPPAEAPDKTLPTQARYGDAPTLPTAGAEPGASAPGPVAPVRVPGYEVLRELGRGGMGVVYLARQEGLNRHVALKMILHGAHAGAEGLARFRAEAQAIARLQHPNIVQVYAVGEQDGLPFFALELCPGGSLAQRFAAGPLPAEAAAGLVSRLARAVHAAHQAGIVHRDLKPANVLLAIDGTPKVSDFGLAKQLGAAGDQTRSGAILGTPNYMAPEQAAGHNRAVTPATDVYALGAILYEALAGRPPFQAATLVETLEQVIRQEPPGPRRLRGDVPADLEAVALQCLEKAPGRRYASAAELADDLDRWQRGEPVQARRQGMLYRLGKRLRKRRRLLVAAAAAALALAALWFGLADGGYSVPGSQGVRRWLDRREWSVFRPAPSAARLRAAAADQRRALARHLLESAMTADGWSLPERTAKAHTDAWTQAQTVAALCATPEADRDRLPRFVPTLDRLFEPNPVCDPFIPGYGWPNYNDGEPSAEASAWALSAFARALTLPGLVPAAERGRLLGRLDQVQTALDNCRSRDRPSGRPTGGWNLFPHQEDPAAANAYITLLVGQGLLELRRADLPWHRSREERDLLLAETLRWLLARFNGRGWATPSRQAEELNDGLTLQVFATLLRAEADGLVQLPGPLLAQVPHHLAECGTRPLDYQITVALFGGQPFRNHLGKTVPRPQRPVRLLWHPWALATAALWERRCERTGAPHDEVVRTRRVLGHLVLTLGDAAVEEAKTGYTYVVAETLLALTALDPP